MMTAMCCKCHKVFETNHINQVLCDDCQNIIKRCSEDNYTLVVLKSSNEWYRAIKYLPETNTVMIMESDNVTNSVDLNFIIAVRIGCEKCDPTRRHTNKDDINSPPNILSPADTLKGTHNGFSFCPYCGRGL